MEVVCWVERMNKIVINVSYSSSFAICSNSNEKMHAETHGSTNNKSHNDFFVLKIRLLKKYVWVRVKVWFYTLVIEGLDESSKQFTLWIIGFSVALGVSVVFIITTCILTILR